MAVFRINKTSDYTIMSNYHFKERKMSLKAKGLLSLMLSLPDDWDYSIEGLTTICQENDSSIRTILKELEEFGYLERIKKQNTRGQFEYEYNIYEKPHTKKPHMDNPHTDNPHTESPYTENQGQLNTNILNTKELNTKERVCFKKPTLSEIEDYINEKELNVNAKSFYDYFETGNWIDSKGNKVKNWKQKLLTWNNHAKEDKQDNRIHFDSSMDYEKYYINLEEG